MHVIEIDLNSTSARSHSSRLSFSALRTVNFERDSTLRSLERNAFGASGKLVSVTESDERAGLSSASPVTLVPSLLTFLAAGLSGPVGMTFHD
jgi:hypothetical protein